MLASEAIHRIYEQIQALGAEAAAGAAGAARSAEGRSILTEEGMEITEESEAAPDFLLTAEEDEEA